MRRKHQEVCTSPSWGVVSKDFMVLSQGCFATARGMNLLLVTAGNAGSLIMTGCPSSQQIINRNKSCNCKYTGKVYAWF